MLRTLTLTLSQWERGNSELLSISTCANWGRSNRIVRLNRRVRALALCRSFPAFN
jgi:hypothetical protein